jgi:hypothetical protein
VVPRSQAHDAERPSDEPDGGQCRAARKSAGDLAQGASGSAGPGTVARRPRPGVTQPALRGRDAEYKPLYAQCLPGLAWPGLRPLCEGEGEEDIPQTRTCTADIFLLGAAATQLVAQ